MFFANRDDGQKYLDLPALSSPQFPVSNEEYLL